MLDITKYPKLFNKYGCWIVEKRGFTKKIEALEYASSIRSNNIQYYYHDHVWNNFDRSLLGKISLPELYKQRAQQLRDKYRYLVLHFSGGSDSYNILHTFLTNNIKLDEIVVKWPKFLIDHKFYTPNAIDKTARNSVSEWDYAIQPVLKIVAQTHPEIKITIADYEQNFFNSKIINNLEKNLEHQGNFLPNYTPAVFFQSVNADIYNPCYDSLQTAHIFGTDKPVLSSDKNSISFHFGDHALSLLAVNQEIGIREPFYWTPDLPLLPFEQAYQCALHIKYNPKFLSYLHNDKKNESMIRGNRILKIQNNLFKEILYKNVWDKKIFQAGKPNSDRSDWYFWFYEISDFDHVKNSFEKSFIDITQKVDQRWFADKNKPFAGFLRLSTVGFKVLEF